MKTDLVPTALRSMMSLMGSGPSLAHEWKEMVPDQNAPRTMAMAQATFSPSWGWAISQACASSEMVIFQL